MKDATPVRIGATMSDLVHESVLTCPKCGFASAETMSTDACQFFYECMGCGAMLKPNSGDCCVFCSFGSVKCPPIQAKSSCDITHPAPRGACESSPASPREAPKVRLPCVEDPGSRRPLNTSRRSQRR